MIESDVETRIAPAMEIRRSQRDFVEVFIQAWVGFGHSFKTLISARESAERTLSGMVNPPLNCRHGCVLPSGPNVQARRAPRRWIIFSIAFALGRERARAVSAWVDRDAGDIGVVERAKAGHSTLVGQ